MEDGVQQHEEVVGAPPPPPEPSANADTDETWNGDAFETRSDEPLVLNSENWDINSISAKAALCMLVAALQTLSESMGDVPPTPPVSRPATPRREPSPETSSAMAIGSPEAHPHEPITITVEVGTRAEDIEFQRVAIARRFFSKVAPAISLSDYLLRLHTYCPHSPGVYLAAAVYIHRLCVAEIMVPATSRTIHRLSLASIRVAAKALEDNKWSQERMAGVGGVSRTQLMNLEVTLCFLLDFDLGMDCDTLAKRMFLLQQAAKQTRGTRSRLTDGFKLRLPMRTKTREVLAAS